MSSRAKDKAKKTVSRSNNDVSQGGPKKRNHRVETEPPSEMEVDDFPPDVTPARPVRNTRATSQSAQKKELLMMKKGPKPRGPQPLSPRSDIALTTPRKAASVLSASDLSETEENMDRRRTVKEQKTDDEEEVAPDSDEETERGDSSYAATTGYNEMIEEPEFPERAPKRGRSKSPHQAPQKSAKTHKSAAPRRGDASSPVPAAPAQPTREAPAVDPPLSSEAPVVGSSTSSKTVAKPTTKALAVDTPASEAPAASSSSSSKAPAAGSSSSSKAPAAGSSSSSSKAPAAGSSSSSKAPAAGSSSSLSKTPATDSLSKPSAKVSKSTSKHGTLEISQGQVVIVDRKKEAKRAAKLKEAEENEEEEAEEKRQAKKKKAKKIQRQIQRQIELLREQLHNTLDDSDAEALKPKKKTVKISDKSRTFHFSDPGSVDESSDNTGENDSDASKKGKGKQKKGKGKGKGKGKKKAADDTDDVSSDDEDDGSESGRRKGPTNRTGKVAAASASAAGTLAYLRGQPDGGSDFAPLLKTQFLLQLCINGWWPTAFHRTAIGLDAYNNAVDIWKEMMKDSPVPFKWEDPAIALVKKLPSELRGHVKNQAIKFLDERYEITVPPEKKKSKKGVTPPESDDDDPERLEAQAALKEAISALGIDNNDFLFARRDLSLENPVGSHPIIYALVEHTLYKPNQLTSNKVAQSLFPPKPECLAFFVVAVQAALTVFVTGKRANKEAPFSEADYKIRYNQVVELIKKVRDENPEVWSGMMANHREILERNMTGSRWLDAAAIFAE